MSKQIVRLKPDVRSDQILSAAIRVVKRNGWDGLIRDRVAEEADCAVGTINNMFDTMEGLRDQVMKRVISLIETGDHCDELIMVVATGLGSGHTEAKKAPRMVKDLALLMMGRD